MTTEISLSDTWSSFPPVTKLYALSSITLTLLCSMEIFSPLHLYLNWRLILYHRECWRLLTCFLYFGDFSLHLCWNLYMCLEKNEFRDRPADFLWFFVNTAAILLVMHYIFNASLFLSGAFLNVLTYVWSRKNTRARVGLFLISVEAPYLPWLLLALSFFIGAGFKDHLFGIVAGHIYYFFEDIYPLMPTSKNFRLFKPPRSLRWVLRQKDEDSSIGSQ